MKRQTYKSILCGTLAILVLASYSCNGIKTTSKPKTNPEHQVKTEIKESVKLVSIFDLSARTKLFIKDVEEELNSMDISIENYEPSDGLVQKYGLKKQDDEYIIRGFIKSTSSFEKSGLESKGVNFGRKTGELMTISFPLNFLQEFLAIDNVTYFEISEPVTLK